MKNVFVILFLLFSINAFAQEDYIYIDPITIKPDGTSQRFSYKDRTHHSDRFTTGLHLTFYDSGFTKIRTQVIILNGKMNGVYKYFSEKGLLLELCTFIDSQEDGYYYYWNEKGILIKKELWKAGKKIKDIPLNK